MKRNGWMMTVILFLLFCGAILYHKQIRDAVLCAGNRCVHVIVPSLYLFAILSAFLVSSGILSFAGTHFPKGDLWIALLFSQIGGYPMGAQLLDRLCREGDLNRKHAGALLCVSMNAGPAFLLGTVCRNMPPEMVLLVTAAVSFPNLFFGAWMLLRDPFTAPRERQIPVCNSEVFQSSVEKGAAAMVRICSTILAFSALQAMAEPILGCFLEERHFPFIRSILEISTVGEYMAAGGRLPTAAALLSFGGICVHMQIAALWNGKIPWKRFFICRILCSLCAYGICRSGLWVMQTSDLAVSLDPTGFAPAQQGESPVPGLCLIIMSLLLLRQAGRNAVIFSKKH